MRVLIAVVCASALWLYACTQPPIPDDELFDCEFSKDGKFLICHDRKQTKVAHD